jgi:hypothetical protein
MIRALGLPQLFYTMTMYEHRWTHLKRILHAPTAGTPCLRNALLIALCITIIV